MSPGERKPEKYPTLQLVEEVINTFLQDPRGLEERKFPESIFLKLQAANVVFRKKLMEGLFAKYRHPAKTNMMKNGTLVPMLEMPVQFGRTPYKGADLLRILYQVRQRALLFDLEGLQ
jgi:hypothetical protein